MIITPKKKEKTTKSENSSSKQDRVKKTNCLKLPYKGLEPFSEEDSDIFCSRDPDINCIINKLELRRISVLYGKSGIGKSSVIHAGVVPKLLEKAKDNLINYGYPKLAVVVFSLEEGNYLSERLLEEENCTSDSLVTYCLREVKKKIEEQIQTLHQEIYEQKHLFLIELSLDPPTDSLSETLQKWGKNIKGDIYFIFDQFEANFFEEGWMNNELTEQLINAVNDSTVPLHSLVVIREDFLAKLDYFKGKIDEPLDHRLELEGFSRKPAKIAITQPLSIYNQRRKNESLEDRLLEVDENISGASQICDLACLRGDKTLGLLLVWIMLWLDPCEKIFRQGQVGDGENEPIELLLLQLVMKSIWEEEVKQCEKQNKSKICLTKGTFEKLGETQGIARKHLQNSLDELSSIDELKNCEKLEFILAILFPALVTAAASKIPRTVEELDKDKLLENVYNHYKLQKLTRDQLTIVLNKLADFRILRTLRQNKYEIFHEVFCQVILEWYAKKHQELEDETRNKHTKETLNKYTKYTRIAQNLAFQSSQKYQNREYTLSLRLAYTSCHFSRLANDFYDFSPEKPEGQGNGIINKVLRKLLEKSDVFLPSHLPLSPHKKQVSVVAFSPKGKWLASGSYDGKVHIYRADNLEEVLHSLNCSCNKPNSPKYEGVHALSFWSDDDEKEAKLAIGTHYGNVFLADVNQEKYSLERWYSHEQTDNNKETTINSIAFSPDGKYVASGSSDKTVEIFKVENPMGKPIWKLTHPEPSHRDWIWSVAFNPQNSQQLAVGCRNGTVVLYYLDQLDKEGKPRPQTLSIHVALDWREHDKHILREREICCVAFSPNGKTLAAGGRDTIIRLWDLEHLNPDDQAPKVSRQLIGHQNMVRSLSFSPDSLLLASGSDDDTDIRIWHLSDEIPLSMVLKAQSKGISSLAFNPNQNELMLVSGSWDYLKDRTQNQTQPPNVLLWEWKREKSASVRELKKHNGYNGHKGVVKAVAFSQDDQYLVSTGYDATVKRWTWKDNCPGEEKSRDFCSGEKQPQEQKTLAINENNSLVAAAGIDGIIRVWDINTPDELKGELDVQKQEVRSLAFSSDGQWLASGGSDEGAEYIVHLWKYVDHEFSVQEIQSEQISNALRSFGEETDTNPTVRSLSFSPNNQWLLTGGESNRLHLWNTNDYDQPIHSEPFDEAITWVAFRADSPHGTWVAAATEKENIYLWDLQVGTQTKFDPNSSIMLRGGCLAFSPKDQILASGGRNGVIYLWDLQQLKTPPILLKGHKHGIRGLCFSHDGQYLASASDDQTIRIWVVRTSRLAQMAEERLKSLSHPHPYLTEKEWKEFVGTDVPYPHETANNK